MKTMRKIGLVAGGLLTMILSLDGAAAGQTHIQGIPGANCVPRNVIPADTFYEYDGRSLRNTSGVGWEFFVAVCPVSEFLPMATAEEVRVFLTTVEEDRWCAVYDPGGEEAFWGYTGGTFLGSGGFWVPPRPWWEGGFVEFTLHCLLGPGDSIDRIEIVWNVP